MGKGSIGEFYSVALTKNYQQADTGTKMIHIGVNTKSKIISKGISFGNSKNTYRGLIKILSKASNTKSYSQCDALLVGNYSIAKTIPYLEIQNDSTQIEHEASISNISEDQLFYFLQRCINKKKAISILVLGFCNDIFDKLPFEFASEVEQLVQF
tara:strand:+ start:1225 stop:1689 length:465 start_codon:yes stop_codon:yes gene_type:complete